MKTPRRSKSDEIMEIAVAWELLCPTKSFSGMTLEQFKEIVQPSIQMRAELKALETRMQAAMKQREREDAAALELTERVLEAVRNDPEEGENSELYEQMSRDPASAGSAEPPRARGKKAKKKKRNAG